MEVDSKGSLFIRLPPPHGNMIITEPHYSDGETVLVDFNNPLIYMNLAGPPFPYTSNDWDERFSRVSKTSSMTMEEWKGVEASRQKVETGAKKWVGTAVPVTAIREINNETGEEKFLG